MEQRTGWIAFALLTLAGCTGLSQRESAAEQYQQFMDYAGTPIDSFSVLGRINGWKPLGGHSLVVWTGVNEAYLLRLARPCDSELSHALSIGLSSNIGSVSRGFDSVNVGNFRCTITEIRPIDYRQMKADLRAARGD